MSPWARPSKTSRTPNNSAVALGKIKFTWCLSPDPFCTSIRPLWARMISWAKASPIPCPIWCCIISSAENSADKFASTSALPMPAIGETSEATWHPRRGVEGRVGAQGGVERPSRSRQDLGRRGREGPDGRGGPCPERGGGPRGRQGAPEARQRSMGAGRREGAKASRGHRLSRSIFGERPGRACPLGGGSLAFNDLMIFVVYSGKRHNWEKTHLKSFRVLAWLRGLRQVTVEDWSATSSHGSKRSVGRNQASRQLVRKRHPEPRCRSHHTS